MLDRSRTVLPQSSDPPTSLALTREPEPQGTAFNWTVERNDYHKLNSWVYQYRVFPNRKVQGSWHAHVYVNHRPAPHSADVFEGPDAKREALDFCEQHALTRLTFTPEEKAVELERIAPAMLSRILMDAAVSQGRAYDHGGNIVFHPGESRYTVDLRGEGVEL